MKLAVCLHAATVARAALPLHPTDRRAIALGLSVGATVIVVEAVGERGSGPIAAREALEAGAQRAVRIVEPALVATNAHAMGLVLCTALQHLEVDVVLWGDDADPEGLGDVPASLAHQMRAVYLTGAVDLKRGLSGKSGSDGDGDGVALAVTLRAGPWLRDLRLRSNVVVGVAPSPRGNETGGPDTPPAKKRPPVQVLTFADLKIEPELVRRRDDLRGVVEAAPRPLVTLQSAAAVGALLRRG